MTYFPEPSRITISSPGGDGTAKTSKIFPRKRDSAHRTRHQQQQDLLHINNPAAHWVEEAGDAEILNQRLSPDDAVATGTAGSSRDRRSSRSRFSLSRLIPSASSPSRSRSSRRSPSATSSRTNGSEDNDNNAAAAVSPCNSPHLSPVSSFSSGGPFSRRRRRRRRSSSSTAGDVTQEQQAEVTEGYEPRAYRSPIANLSPPTRRPRQPSPPPAYSDRATPASGPTLGPSPPYETPAHVTPARGRVADDGKDEHAYLSQFDTIFLIDDSMSMEGRSWDQAKKALKEIAPVCTKYDEDGVDVYFLNHQSGEPNDPAQGSAGTGYRHVRSAAQVERLFDSVGEPAGPWTLTGKRLHQILHQYLRHYEGRIARAPGGDVTCVKPINVIVITDGAPTDEPGDVIRLVARKLDRLGAPPYQVGIQFFQVGDDPDASAALRQLDEGLRTHSHSHSRARRGREEEEEEELLRDIVDTVTFDGTASGGGLTLSEDGISKTVLGAVNRRYDRMDLDARREQRRGQL